MSETAIAPSPDHAGRPLQPLTCTYDGATEITGLSKTSIRLLVRQGKLRTIVLAGRPLILVSSIRQLIGEPE